MRRQWAWELTLLALVARGGLSAQSPARVDFQREVQPIFKAKCIACHGPTQQMNGFRLDRRSAALRGGTIAVIGPGNSEGSRLYHRLIGNQFGLQMPPTGALSAGEINTIKEWIDQGAVWPDEAAGETPPPPPDPVVARMMNALRAGDKQGFREALRGNPKAVNRRGLGGSTPLMFAVFYGDLDSVRLLLKKGADPNARNDVGATALMWAAGDVDNTQLLLDHGADANILSDYSRTALMIAAGRIQSAAVVKLLLDRGADPNTRSPTLIAVTTALGEAAASGGESTLRLLIERGADVKGCGFMPLLNSMYFQCAKCADLFLPGAGPEVLNPTMVLLAPPLHNARLVRPLLERGADPNAKDPGGNTILMLAASSEAVPVETVKELLERGADVNAKNPHGETALELARRQGPTRVVDMLIAAGAKQSGGPSGPQAKPKPAESIRAAIERSVPLLQRTDESFLHKSGCVSCHNNSLTAMTVAAVRRKGLPVDAALASKQVKEVANYLEGWRERALQGIGIPGDWDTISYILLGLAAQNHPPDLATDAMADFLRSRQRPNGQWVIFAHRPPLESSDIQVTATCLRALQAYAPKVWRAEYEQAIQRAAAWLAAARPEKTEDRAFHLLGLRWAGAEQALIQKTARDLLAQQRPDGGWSQTPSLASDAYATGQSLVALKESGALEARDPAYQRGVAFLLNSQYEDGSWYVGRRTMPIQPSFENGFPHGRDQWISATATNWATMALAHAVQ